MMKSRFAVAVPQRILMLFVAGVIALPFPQFVEARLFQLRKKPEEVKVINGPDMPISVYVENPSKQPYSTTCDIELAVGTSSMVGECDPQPSKNKIFLIQYLNGSVLQSGQNDTDVRYLLRLITFPRPGPSTSYAFVPRRR